MREKMDAATFWVFFRIEGRDFRRKANVMVFLVLLTTSMMLTQINIGYYKDLSRTHREYSEIEKTRAEHFQNFTQYGMYGVQIFYTPPPLEVFFGNPGMFYAPSAFIDSGEKLRFDAAVKGKSIFRESSAGFMNLAGLLMLLGVAFSLYTGYGTFRNAEYVRFLSTFADFRRVARLMMRARQILLTLFFLMLTIPSFLLLPLNGIRPTAADAGCFAVFSGILILMQWICFNLGVSCSAVSGRSTGILTAIVIWFVFVFLVPWGLRLITFLNATGITSAPTVELEKIKTIMAVEQILKSEYGTFSGNGSPASEAIRKAMEEYLTFKVPMLQQREEKLITEVENNVHLISFLSPLFPSTFYIQTGYAVGGKNYERGVDFFRYCLRMKLEFQKYYIRKKFLTGYHQVESFIKGEENIYHSQPGLPHGFLWGLCLNLFYLFFSRRLALGGVRRRVFSVGNVRSSKFPEEGLEIDLRKGEIYVLITENRALKRRLFGFLSGVVRDFRGVARLDDDLIKPEEQTGSSGKPHFVYICRPSALPGALRVNDFIRLIKQLADLKEKEAAAFYLALPQDLEELAPISGLTREKRTALLLAAAKMKRAELIMMDDLLTGISLPELQPITRSLRELKTGQTAVICLIGDMLTASRIGDAGGLLQNASPQAVPDMRRST